MTTYDPNKWTSHLFDIEGSLVREIMGRVSLCVAWAAIVVVLYDYGPQLFDNLAIVETAHGMIGPALGLLLVFRTNTAYDRFWEGRKQWGGIVNESRNLARQAESWLSADRDLANEVILWTTAFAYATMHRLRGAKSIGAACQGLPSDQVQLIEQSAHVPFAVSRKLTELLYDAHKRGLIDPVQHRSCELNVQALVDYCGACERIRSTPAPFGYVVHLRRALILYCLTLPLALIKNYDWETVPVTLVISYIMFGIEEIGVEIENPFEAMINDLPLESICATIDGDLRSITDAKEPKLLNV
jgi:putative membrane protein